MYRFSSQLLQGLTSRGKYFWPSLQGCVSSLAFKTPLLLFNLLYLVPNHTDVACGLRGPVTQGKQPAKQHSSSKVVFHEEIKLFLV